MNPRHSDQSKMKSCVCISHTGKVYAILLHPTLANDAGHIKLMVGVPLVCQSELFSLPFTFP